MRQRCLYRIHHNLSDFLGREGLRSFRPIATGATHVTFILASNTSVAAHDNTQLSVWSICSSLNHQAYSGRRVRYRMQGCIYCQGLVTCPFLPVYFILMRIIPTYIWPVSCSALTGHHCAHSPNAEHHILSYPNIFCRLTWLDPLEADPSPAFTVKRKGRRAERTFIIRNLG